jgi:hypothetical protein
VTLLEAVVIVLLCLALFTIGDRLYQAFFGPDKGALNTFNLLADNVNSLIKNSNQEQQLQFQFTAHHRDDYKGTIFGFDSTHVVTDPFPPMSGADRAAFDAAKSQVNGASIQNAKCDGKPCLCFSQRTLMATDTQEVILNVFQNPTTCQSFDVPHGAIVKFAVTPADTNLYLQSKEFPIVIVSKTMTAGTIVIAIEMMAPSAVTSVTPGGGATSGAGASGT